MRPSVHVSVRVASVAGRRFASIAYSLATIKYSLNQYFSTMLFKVWIRANVD